MAMTNEEYKARMRHDFTNHPPVSDEIIRRLEGLRDSATEFADLIIDLTPDSRERSLALTNLESSLMYARAALARNQGAI